jgi:hypothetical protein
MATSIPVAHLGNHRQTINLGSAVLAGIVGALAVLALVYLADAAGILDIDLLKIIGALFTAPGSNPYYAGAVIALVGANVIAVVYAAIFMLGAIYPTWKTGLGFGFAHWIISGLVLDTVPGNTAWGIPAPGMFGYHYGVGAMVAYLILRLVYGAIVGALYRPGLDDSPQTVLPTRGASRE